MDSLPLPASATTPEPDLPLLIVVEGRHDVHFLKTLFLPIGGSNIKDMAPRVARLNKRMFVLLDQETEPHITDRQEIVAQLNQRPGCVAVLTRKRTLENYLDPTVVAEACGWEVSFDDDTDVAGLLARQLPVASGSPRWPEFSCRGQKRLRARAKKLLNVHAVGRMTVEHLAATDPPGGVRGWLHTIQRLREVGV